MPDLDLAVSVRNYAREQETALVSSAWLADYFSVDPRTIAAALRPYGVKPGEVEPGVRGYSIAELAGIVLPGDVPDVLAGRIPTEASAMPDGWPGPGWHDLVDIPADLPASGLNHWSAGMTDEQVAAEVARTAEVPLSALLTVPEAERVQAAGVEVDSAIVRLSAGAGHDMTPALRAAGLL